jgi:hypothetical protein
METLTETVTTGITFAVDDVAPAQTRLNEESLYDSLERRSGRVFVSLPERERRVVANARFHPLIEAIHRAFADHRPLVLSPDDIWLGTLQVTHHREDFGDDLVFEHKECELREPRLLEGTVQEVLERLIAAEGDPSKL